MATPDEIKSNLIRETVANWSDSQKEFGVAKLIGYEKLPPTIQEVLENDFYLGHLGKDLYACWKDVLSDIYPNSITTKSTIITLRGALGIGKSYVSMIIMLMDLIKFGFHPNPFKYLKLNKATSPIFIRLFNLSKEKSGQVLLSPLWNAINTSPYFRERHRDTGEILPHNVNLASAKRSGDVISEVVFGSIISELNFFPAHVARDIVSTVLGRLEGRMRPALGLWSHIVIDSSETDSDSAVNEFIQTGGWSHDLSIYSKSIWEAKPDNYGRTGHFKMYCGDSSHNPFIIPDNISSIELSKLDIDRILTVPNELLPNFKNNPIKALREAAGKATSSGDDFFGDKETIKSRFTLENSLDDLMMFSFFDNESIWDRIGKTILEIIPRDRRIYGRLDLGISHDNAGIALVYGDSASYKDVEGVKVFTGKYKIPVAFAISRYPGEETNISKITEFFIALSKYYEICSITTDQFQSSHSRQIMTENGINAELLSVDRTNNSYIISKSLLMNGQVDVVKNNLLQNEWMNLINVGNKVDHKTTSTKDISDAVVGALFKAFEAGEEAFSQIEAQSRENYNSVLSILAKRNTTRQIVSMNR